MRSHAGRAAAWAISDQALSSASNYLLQFAVLRYFGAREYGLFSLLYALYVGALSLTRAGVATPLMLALNVSREDLQGMTTIPIGVGLAGGLVLVLGGLGASTFTSVDVFAVAALAVALPVLLLQDSYRYVALRQLHARSAATLDGIWLVVQVGLFALVIYSLGRRSLAVFLLIWGAGAAAAAIFGRVNTGIGFSWTGSRFYYRRYSRTIAALTGEAGTVLAVTQLTPFLLASVLSLATVGEIRAAFTIFAPPMMAFLGLAPIVQRLMRHDTTPRQVGRRFIVLGSVLVSFGLAYMTAIASLPSSTVRNAFGTTASLAQPLIVPVGLQTVAAIALALSFSGLRMVRLPATVAKLRAAVALVELAACLAAACLAGAVAAVYSAAIVSTLGAICASLLLFKAEDVILLEAHEHPEQRSNATSIDGDASSHSQRYPTPDPRSVV